MNESGENTLYKGPSNPNSSVPLEKMKITNLDDKSKSLTVLYNPASYVQEKSVQYQAPTRLEQGAPLVQFAGGEAEVLSFELFFDSLSAGAEVGGSRGDRGQMSENKGRASAAGNAVDVREYTQKVYSLMYVLDKKHRPPKLRIEWASLQFQCFLQSCTQTFTKFNESGKPVRARLQCRFIQHLDEDKLASGNPLESPDTTKYRTVRQGDSLWALAAAEYGDAAQWRVIADANRIENPRELRPGTVLVLPALVRTD